ncbi:hypothetical protein AGMMS50222_01390 [Endomicrobiia bacterium]|nr:hypothetical protein AGMMS50222_01390 [Endomicrobiia bacterium]
MKRFFLVFLFVIVLNVSVFVQGNANQNIEEKLGIGFNATSHDPSLGRASQSLKGKIGIGYNAASRDPSWAAKYWLTDTLGVEGFTGFRIGNENSSFVIGGKVLNIIKSYKYLNVFVSAALSLEHFPLDANSVRTTHINSVPILASVGFEWFALDNLSFSTELGLKLKIAGDATEFLSNVGPCISIKFYI